jgi:hypothetical protein
VGKDFRDDGHTRISKGKDWVVEGGTKESHEETSDVVNHFSKRLRREGENVDSKTAKDILKDVIQERKRRN